MIAANDAGGLGTDEMNSLLIASCFVASYDTSKNVLTMIMHELLKIGRRSMHALCRGSLVLAVRWWRRDCGSENPATIPAPGQ